MPQTPFTVACGLSLALLILPAPWHIKARNAGTILYIAWSFVGNLVYLVNSIVWSGKRHNPAPIWCDISTKIIIGLNVALPCVSLCIQRRLHQISRISQVQTTYDQRRRQIYIDVSIGLGAPLLIMALHYIVQGHRFDIIEDYGCWPNTYVSWPAFVVLIPWATIFSTISLIYATLTFRNFLRRRSTFNELLKSQNTGLSVNKYIRLMALASLEMLFVFPMSVVVLVHNASGRINPWISWENTHYNFSRVGYISLFLFRLNRKNFILFELTRWCVPLSGFLFFLFFGMASEARKQYKKTWNAIMRQLGITSPTLTFTEDRKDAPTTSASARTKRPSYVKSGSTSTTMPMTSPTMDKKRPDTFAWLEEGLPFDELDYKLPTSPGTAYSPTKSHGGRPSHMPCTPSTSTSTSSTSHLWDTTSTIGRHASISTARTGKTTRFSQDDYADDATICGVPTSLKRSDSMGDKPLPEIPFEDFAYFRQSQIDNRNRDRERQSAALSIHSASSSSAASIGGRKSRSLSLSQLMLPTLTQEQETGHADADNSFVLGDMVHHGFRHHDGDEDGDQVQITARHSAAPSSELDLELETQVQIFVSSPTSTTFTSRDPDHEH
ncbi:a-factor receptor, partial [Serendipita sp. 400]